MMISVPHVPLTVTKKLLILFFYINMASIEFHLVGILKKTHNYLSELAL